MPESRTFPFFYKIKRKYDGERLNANALAIAHAHGCVIASSLCQCATVCVCVGVYESASVNRKEINFRQKSHKMPSRRDRGANSRQR